MLNHGDVNVVLSEMFGIILFLFLPLPLMIGVLGSLQGALASFMVIANAGATPRPSEIAAGIAMALCSSLVGLLVTFPSYFVLAGGLFLRTIQDRPTGKKLL